MLKQVPVPVLGLYGRCVQTEFDTLTVYISDICRDVTIECSTGSSRYGGNQVFGLTGVVVETTGDAVFEETEIKAHIP